MHTRTQVIWFGMFLGAALLGCPPAAKDAKDAKDGAGQATEEKAGEAKDEAKDEAKKTEGTTPPTPAPSGGW